MRDQIFQKLSADKDVQKIARNVQRQSFRITGLNDSAESLLLSLLGQNASTLLIVADELKAREFMGLWLAFSELPAYTLLPRPLIFTDVIAASREIELQRLAILDRWVSGEPCLIIAAAANLLEYLPPPAFFSKNSLVFEVGQQYSLQTILQDLQKIGYERVTQIEAAGQYALRGDILDLGLALPDQLFGVQSIRLSFFDQELENIREFDFETQRSLHNISEIRVPPAKEWLIDETQRTSLAAAVMDASREQAKIVLQQGGDAEQAEAFERLGKRDAGRIREGMHLSALDRWFFLLEQEKSSLLRMVQELNSILAFDEVLQIQKRLDAATADFYQQMQSYLEKEQIVKGTKDVRIDLSAAWQNVTTLPTLSFAGIDSSGNGISGSEKISFAVRESDSYRGRETALLEDLQNRQKAGRETFIFTGNISRKERLQEMLFEHGLTAELSEDYLGQGFSWPSVNLTVIGTTDLFGAEQRRRRRKKQGIAIDFLSDLKPGDYVVHENHGIGIYNGLKTLHSGGKTGDYLHISYAGDDQLYVSVEQLQQIQKYVSAGGGKPKLSKLDGKSWETLKNRARDSIKKLATDLVKLYSERMQLKGHNFGPDSVWQEQFEEAFPYQETEDQLIAIDEVKSDMESDKVMDRLLCGDVGYGKTEVAFRAMFKAAIDGKQAAILVPTTVLAQQHYENLLARIADFPLKIALLCRFVPKQERKKIIKRIASGDVDIVVGTHRILSKDIKFHNLGLLVIDEEQRFGVDHKEGIKAKYPAVDVLSMTATPIPRTLHMSISGIRDISIIEEAPSDRRPVQTYVMEYDQKLIEEAILREISRGGQIFYLFNNTHKIAEKAQALREALPGLRVEYAHGQMSEKSLENVIEDFIAHKFDLLVCTTIIESGVDMPNVNTIIVENADRLGLAQLYQIRGRVGRSERQAYAYITYDPNRVLTEDSTKRLAAIRDYTELGSGFKIAMRDLEVRGAGNLLGAEQHGHMEAIGYELYCKMLEENVKEIQGTAKSEQEQIHEAQVELAIDAGIPESYIQSEGLRLDLYRRISQIHTVEAYRDVLDELIDRFGDPPQLTLNLCRIALLRSLAGSLGVDRIFAQNEDILFSFEDQKPNMEMLAEILDGQKQNQKLLFNAGVKPYLLLREGLKAKDPLQHMLQIFSLN